MIEKIWIRDGKKSDPESGKTSRIRNTVVIFFLFAVPVCNFN